MFRRSGIGSPSGLSAASSREFGPRGSLMLSATASWISLRSCEMRIFMIRKYVVLSHKTGFEPVPPGLQPGALPLSYKGMVVKVGIEPTTPGSSGQCSTD